MRTPGNVPGKAKKPKLPKISTIRNRCDALLTPIIKKMYPRCLLQAPNCYGATQVAHHHVHKSKSTRLRYYIPNLIPLCNHCHLVLHNNESYWASVIVQRKGVEWFDDLARLDREIVKADVHYYLENHERLSTYPV